MPKIFAVIGLGTFGSAVAMELARRGYEVFACDRDPEKIEEIGGELANAVELDATDEKALRDAGLDEVDTALVSFGEPIADSLLVTMLLKEIGVREVVVKVTDDRHSRLVKRIGADRVIYPERDMSSKLVESLLSPNIFDVIEFSGDYSLVEMAAPKKMLGKKLADLHLRKRFGVNVIAIKSKVAVVNKKGMPDIEERVNIAPGPDDEIAEGDILVVLGRDKEIRKLKKI
ncbi:TrkA family potassium uptake protein [candidate division WOR-3 bacterium]|nr:TrkA family potassium uptake protein [candidate division WOR-3 bacterium]